MLGETLRNFVFAGLPAPIPYRIYVFAMPFLEPELPILIDVSGTRIIRGTWRRSTSVPICLSVKSFKTGPRVVGVEAQTRLPLSRVGDRPRRIARMKELLGLIGQRDALTNIGRANTNLHGTDVETDAGRHFRRPARPQNSRDGPVVDDYVFIPSKEQDLLDGALFHLPGISLSFQVIAVGNSFTPNLMFRKPVGLNNAPC
jgi:hypothetical protein